MTCHPSVVDRAQPQVVTFPSPDGTTQVTLQVLGSMLIPADSVSETLGMEANPLILITQARAAPL